MMETKDIGAVVKLRNEIKPQIGLDDVVRKRSVQILNTILADEYILYTKARKYHWNVAGPMFNDLHKFFEDLYTELNNIVDAVAERAQFLGGYSLGTLSEFLAVANIEEDPGECPNAKKMVSSLLQGYETLIRNIRGELSKEDHHTDVGTMHFLTEIIQKHEKSAWMLRSLLFRWEE